MTETPAKAQGFSLTPAPADGVRQRIAEALCCPTTGCVRTDDCLAGERREQREQLEAVLAALAALPAQDTADGVREALAAAHSEIVMAIAFLGRDSNTGRLQGTVDGLIGRLALADAAARATLAALPAQDTAKGK